METIIYLYHSRDAVNFAMEKWQESDYCLMRLGIPMLLWQNLQQFEREEKQRQRQDGPENRELCMISCLEELKDWQTALLLLSDNPYWTTCAYEEALRERVNAKIWRQYWRVPEFDAYRGNMWVEKLLQYATWDRYMILGCESCIPEILWERAKRMRSVRWILKGKQYTGELQAFVEGFYEETGLAIEVMLMENDEEWRRVCPASMFPVNVLDFSGEEKISAWNVARGSVWLDMDSMEQKCRRIESRNTGINYFSLKKQWKQRQKETVNLDTINKNRYNT